MQAQERERKEELARQARIEQERKARQIRERQEASLRQREQERAQKKKDRTRLILQALKAIGQAYYAPQYHPESRLERKFDNYVQQQRMDAFWDRYEENRRRNQEAFDRRRQQIQ